MRARTHRWDHASPEAEALKTEANKLKEEEEAARHRREEIALKLMSMFQQQQAQQVRPETHCLFVLVGGMGDVCAHEHA